jgi:GNAT superfamily N-acetyltransferase
VLTVRIIPAAETRPLRQKVLRPHQRIEDLLYSGDESPEARHFGAFRANELVGTASIYREAPGPAAVNAPPAHRCFRLRGMAVEPELQGTGVGARLIEACLEHIRKSGGTYFWCNARVSARAFYERHGFTARGEEFELPGIGPHLFMERAVTER